MFTYVALIPDIPRDRCGKPLQVHGGGGGGDDRKAEALKGEGAAGGERGCQQPHPQTVRPFSCNLSMLLLWFQPPPAAAGDDGAGHAAQLVNSATVEKTSDGLQQTETDILLLLLLLLLLPFAVPPRLSTLPQ